MKTKNLLFMLCLLVLAPLCIGINSIVAQKSTAANAFLSSSQTLASPLAEEAFSINMTANCRRKNVFLRGEEKTITNSLGITTTFLCFKWKDLESLSFHISQNEEMEISSFKFLATYVQSETLSPSFGTGSTTTLFEGQNFEAFDYFYYVDSNLPDKNTSNSHCGNDFGLYKFDFSYFYLQDNTQVGKHQEINVAVFPDDIESIDIPLNTTILYSISSSNKLMNVFNMYLSTDAFKYVNPAKLQWQVVGKDTSNTNYCLDEAMQQQMEYGSFEVLWHNIIKTTGPTFTFDSNNVEGIWQVSLIIKNNDGSQRATFKVENISTIKFAQKSYLWLILLIVFIVLAIVCAILLIVFFKRKKKEKVW